MPAAVQADPAATAASATTSTPTTSAKPAAVTLLLVDDEPSVLSALRRLFRPQGYTIVQATSGAEALALLPTSSVDVVISDMRMPEMDGAAFLEQVRQRQPTAVRILLTGYADITATIAAINRGEIHRYIAKPWNDDELRLIVAQALTRRELEHENEKLLALTQQQNGALQELNHTLEARVAERTSELEQREQLLQQANADLDASFMLAVTVFSGLLEMRQDGIAGHARRVGALARRTAAHLGLDEHAQRDVQLAGLLHDIGKIGFPDAMLGKPVSKYSAEEAARYHRHAQDGETALMALAELHGVALIVRQHHERVDGRGFPDGLLGPAISLGARIVAVCSDYDGLVHGSLAERAYTSTQARKALTEGVGSHYDLKVCVAVLEVLAAIDAEAIAEVAVDVKDLQPRMQLAHDLLSPQGAILLAQGHRFDAAMIAKLKDFAGRNELHLMLPILCSSMPAVPNGTAPGASSVVSARRMVSA